MGGIAGIFIVLSQLAGVGPSSNVNLDLVGLLVVLNPLFQLQAQVDRGCEVPLDQTFTELGQGWGEGPLGMGEKLLPQMPNICKGQCCL